MAKSRKKPVKARKRAKNTSKKTRKKTSNKRKSKSSRAKKKVTKSRKKAVKKPKVEVTVSRKVLGEAPEEYHFVLQNGKKLKSVQELTESLETMSEDVFKHHVNEFRNDFATWINDIFEEKDLAGEIRNARNRIETRIKLLQRMVDEVIKEGKKVKKKR